MFKFCSRYQCNHREKEIFGKLNLGPDISSGILTHISLKYESTTTGTRGVFNLRQGYCMIFWIDNSITEDQQARTFFVTKITKFGNFYYFIYHHEKLFKCIWIGARIGQKIAALQPTKNGNYSVFMYIYVTKEILRQ